MSTQILDVDALQSGGAEMKNKSKRIVGIAVLLLVLLFLLLGLNYRQLYMAWATRSETRRLESLAADAPEEFQNPPALEDRFQGKLSPDFWEFNAINGGGIVSNDSSFHSAAIVFDDSLTMQHSSDPLFKEESPAWHSPSSSQYNNISLIGGSGFRPSLSEDMVLKFTARASEGFYGTAGVIFQQIGTLQKDGLFAKPFDMFGFAVIGKESSVMGVNGPLCYLALQQIPVHLKPLQVDLQNFHAYEVRLHWVSQTKWQGSLTVDGKVQCQIGVPPFGPVEVHAWSDNALVLSHPRRWWEFGPPMELSFQNGGEKWFSLGMIQVFTEKR